jgi:hypothetical protein
MRLLLDHPSADAAAMMMHGCSAHGRTALMYAAWQGNVEAMRLLLDHPSADPVAMMAIKTTDGASALTAAAQFAVGQPTGQPTPARSCAPLLLLLRRATAEPQPSDAQQAHMTIVMETFCRGPLTKEMFEDDQPDDVRDECVCMLLEFGARVSNTTTNPCVSRIIREVFAMARVPQRINEAVLGIAAARQP